MTLINRAVLLNYQETGIRDQDMQTTAVDGCFISRTLALVYCLEDHVNKEFGLIHFDFLHVWYLIDVKPNFQSLHKFTCARHGKL